MNKHRVLAVLVVAVLATGAVFAAGTNYTWKGNANGNWMDSSVWTPSSSIGYPQSGDTATVVTVSGSYTNTLNGGIAGVLQQLVLRGTPQYTATLIVTNGTLTLASNATANAFNFGNNGILEVDNAGIFTNVTGTPNWNFQANNVIFTNYVLLGSGGQFFVPSNSASAFNMQSSNQTLYIMSSSPSFGGVWNNNGASFSVGYANGVYSAPNCLCMIDNCVVSNLSSMTLGGGQSGGHDGKLTVRNNAQLWSAGTISVGAVGNPNYTLIVSNNAVIGTPGAGISINVGAGNGTTNCQAWIDHSILTNVCIAVGTTAGSTNNLCVITNATRWWTSAAPTVGSQGPLNKLIITSPGTIGTVLGNASFFVGGSASAAASSNNTCYLLNGATLIETNSLGIGNFAGSTGNGMVVDGQGTALSMWGGFANTVAGVGVIGHTNWMVVSGGARVPVTPINGRIGFVVGNNSCGNTLTIQDPGTFWNIGNGFLSCPGGNSSYPTVGGTNNTILICSNALVTSVATSANRGLYCGYSTNNNGNSVNNTIVISNATYSAYSSGNASVIVCSNTSYGNTITNIGGVYEFGGTVKPVVLSAAPCGIFLNNGTVSFSNATWSGAVDVFCNQSTNFLGPTNMVFLGANALRLNGCTNRGDIAQSYTFDTIYGGTNFAGLVLMNGSTLYTNGTVIIGTNGWVTFTNTTAVIASNFTCYGTMTVANSSVTFNKNVGLSNNCVLNLATTNGITVNGALTLPVSATINAAGVLTNNPATVTVFAVPGGSINGLPSGWTVDKPGYTVSKRGNSVILGRTVGGTAVFFR